MLTLMHSPMAAAVSSTTASSLLQTLPLVLIMVVLLAVMIIPQRKKEKKIKAMLDALKPGDRIGDRRYRHADFPPVHKI